MLTRATLMVDTAKIAHNTRGVRAMVPGVEVVGVTKMTCAAPEVARAMLAGGAAGLADSRLENLEALRAAGVTQPLWLMRAPPPALAEEAVRLADVSLQSESATLDALDAAAARLGRRHDVVLMVDLGDLREGVMPGDLPALVDHTVRLRHLHLRGIGVSLTCYGAIVPSRENLGELVRLTEDAEARLGRRLAVSGGMSSTLDLALAGGLPARVDSLRVGEAILLGVSTVTRDPLPGLHTDTLTLAAPVIECVRKPSLPRGESAQDAFGGRPVFEDRGVRTRAIVAVGRQDAPPEGLVPLAPGAQVIGASSDHLIVDVEDTVPRPAVGDVLEFRPTYAAALRLFTSPYVEKVYVGRTPSRPPDLRPGAPPPPPARGRRRGPPPGPRPPRPGAAPE
jgi:predicted amino acid racemase